MGFLKIFYQILTIICIIAMPVLTYFDQIKWIAVAGFFGVIFQLTVIELFIREALKD